MAASLSAAAGATQRQAQPACTGAAAALLSDGAPPVSAREALQQMRTQQNAAAREVMKKTLKAWEENKGMQFFVIAQLSDGTYVSSGW
jgi:hypothetical protein